MKKQLILFLALGLFVLGSCSNDDDGGAKEASVVATWKLVSMSPPAWDLSCDSASTITFNQNGTTNWTVYDADNNCTAQTSSGTWVNTSGSNYTVTIPDLGEVTGTVTFSGQNAFSFNTTIQGVPVRLNFEKV